MNICLVNKGGGSTATLDVLEACSIRGRNIFPTPKGAWAIELSPEEIECLKGKECTVRVLDLEKDDPDSKIRNRLKCGKDCLII